MATQSKSRPTTTPMPSAAEVCTRFELSEAAGALLRPDHSVDAFAKLLFEKEQYIDLISFWAHFLPKKGAIWWGCLCLWGLCRPEPPPPAATTLNAIVDWLRDGKEENRRRCEASALDAGISAPAGALAMAAFWSEGSISAPNLPKVEAPPFGSSRTVAAAVVSITLKVSGDPVAVYKRVDTLAREVASGKNRWS